MTDKELLEAAARAASVKLHWHAGKPYMRPDVEPMDSWNPLADDGDALRLAVKLGLQITPYPIYTEPKHSVLVRKALLPGDDDESRSVEIIAPYAAGTPESATRRAIVRTAAAMDSGHNAVAQREP